MRTAAARRCAPSFEKARRQCHLSVVSATPTELAEAVDAVGGRAHLVGLCEGGWLSAMLAARFADKVFLLVLEGSPIDTHTGDEPVMRVGRRTPMAYYRYLGALGGGRMRGKFVLAAWKSRHQGEHY